MNIKEKIKKHFKITLLITILLGITIIGLTYAYFNANIIGNTNDKSVIITSAKLELTYNDGNGEILAEKIIPGEVIETKMFNVKNTGTAEIIDYDVNLESVVNNISIKKDLTYVLTCEEYNEKNEYVDSCIGNSGVYPSENATLTTNPIKTGYTHEYELQIIYAETYENQSEDMNKTVKGNIIIYDDTEASSENY